MKLFIHDEFPPEASAMLQALYSRSAESVSNHVTKVSERGSDRFMASYYVGYGHASIGDCGYTSIFVEDISLLACKAIQDNQLFSGQETSTRYIDFSSRPIVDPVGTVESRVVQDRWISFYRECEPIVRNMLFAKLSKPESVKTTVWEKAIAARTFDILRGFLPAGVTSQTAWTTNLRQAAEHSLRLICHPLLEVQQIGRACLDALKIRYPSSFGHEITDQEFEYLKHVSARETYQSDSAGPKDTIEIDDNVDDARLTAEAGLLLRDRPRKLGLPKTLGRFGRFKCSFDIDFGSYRDLQRHRGGLCPMPLLTDHLGIHPWYMSQLPDDIRNRAEQLLDSQKAAIRRLASEGASSEDLQYFQPLGMKVRASLYYDLAQMVYVSELRSGKTVHPTLRKAALDMGHHLQARYPDMAIYLDESPDELAWRRGEHDIIDREDSLRAMV